MGKTCVDLCAGKGGFSAAFEAQPGWEVLTVDVNDEFDADVVADVAQLHPSDLPEAEVYVAGVPCPVFSPASNKEGHFGPDGRPQTERARKHVALAHHVVGLCEANAKWWFLENPQGKLKWFLGEPTGRVTYCQYGRDYQKPTHLWGRHPPGMTYRTCSRGDDCHASNTADDGTSAVGSMPRSRAERAMVPYELSLSILESVEAYPDEHPTLGGSHV